MEPAIQTKTEKGAPTSVKRENFDDSFLRLQGRDEARVLATG